MAARIHRPLKIIAFNENGIWRQRYELSKQMQDLRIDVALLSEKEKAELPLQLEKAFPTAM
jgi:hypothetical protein